MTRKRFTQLFALLMAAVTTTAFAFPPPDGKGGGNGGGNEEPPPPEPELPAIEYQGVTISLPPHPTPYYFLNDFNDSGQACGRNSDFGWIYSPVFANHAVDMAVDANTLDIEGLDAGWVIRNCIGISNNGLVVGRASPVDDASIAASRGYVLDISVTPSLIYELPENGYGWEGSYARKVNDNGDILGMFTRTDGSRGIYFYNLGLRSGPPEFELEIPDLPPVGFAMMNNPPEGVPATVGVPVTTPEGAATNEVLFFTRGDAAAYYPPPEVSREPVVNGFGGIAGRGAIEIPINKKKSEAIEVIYRDYGDEQYIQGYYGIVSGLNNAGTIIIRAGDAVTLYHDDYGFVDVASITAAGQLPTTSPSFAHLNNVGMDGFGQIAVSDSSLPEFHILTAVEVAP